MKNFKINFTIGQDTISRLKETVAEGNRSALVEQAIIEKLDQIEREQFQELLKEGYQERRQEDIEVNDEWEAITLEE